MDLVLSAHGCKRSEEQNDADRIAFFCPFCRRPSTPHFIVFKMIRGGLYNGLKWFCPRTKTSGYGAISLQAALMGCSATGHDLLRVCRELCHIAQWADIPGLSMRPIEKEVAPQTEVTYHLMADFTAEGLFALGCKVTPSVTGTPGETADFRYAFSPFGEDAVPFNPLQLQKDFGLYQVADYTTTAQHRGGEEVSLCYEASEFAPIFVLEDERVSSKTGKPYKVCRMIHAGQPNRDFMFVRGEGNHLEKAKRQLMGDRTFRLSLGGMNVPEAVEESGSNEFLETTRTENVADGGELIERTVELKPEDIRTEHVVYCESPLDAIATFYHLNALRQSYVQLPDMEKMYFHVAFPLHPHADFTSAHNLRLRNFARETFVLFPADNDGKKHTFLIGKRYRKIRMAFLPAPFMDNRTATDKSVRNFFLHYRMNDDEAYAFNFDINRLFLSCFTSALTANPLEYCEKLDKKTGKVKEYWYRINSASLWPFMASEGYCREVDHDSTNTIGRFIHLQGPFVKEIDSHSVVAATTAALSTYAQQTARAGSQDYEKMMNAIIMAKEINEKTAVNLPEMDINYDGGYGPKLDHFFYENGALRITPDSITFHPYSELGFNVDKAEILPWKFTMPVAAGEQPFRIEENPEYVKRLTEIENHKKDTAHYTLQQIAEERGRLMEWSQTHRWTFDFFGKPEKDWWPALRVLRCFANEEWEKEEELHRNGEEFDEDDENLLQGHLANLLFSMGRPLWRYRNTAHNCIPYLLENKVSSENKAEGGSGKSVFVNLFMGCAGKILKIDGRNIKADKEFSLHLASYQHHCHRVVHWEDLDSVPLTDLYNYATSGFSYRRLFQDVTTIKFSESPGHIISSNKSPLKADDSTMRRISLAGFSHRFAGENVHKNKPARLISDVMPGFQTEPELLSDADRNQIAYICALAVQFCMNCPDKVSAPQTDVKNRTMARNLGESFVRWATSFFAQPWVYNCPIDRETIFQEYKEICEASEDKQTKFSAAAFKEKLKQYCALNSIVFNPKVCLISKTEQERDYLRRQAWHIVHYFEDRRVWGDRPQKDIRELQQCNCCLWFSRAGEEPKSREEVLSLYEAFCKAEDPSPIRDADNQVVVLTEEEKTEIQEYYGRRQGKSRGNSSSSPVVDTKTAQKPDDDLPF